MKKSKATKRTLLLSVLAMLLCMVMLVGTTFAWFTDSASTAVNKIQAGTLDVDLVDKSGESLEGKTLNFVKAAGAEQILWEPGATYALPAIKIVNNGNLWLKYKVEVAEGITKKGQETSGVSLLNAIDFYVIEGEVTTTPDLSVATTLADYFAALNEEGAENIKTLAPKGEGGNETGALTIVGHMKETAGNEYQGLKLDGVAITVLATQYTKEHDSYTDQYDKDAEYSVVVADEASLKQALEDGKNVRLGSDIALTSAVTFSGDVEVVGDGNSIISSKEVYVAPTANVSFKNVNFANPVWDNNKASSVYASGLKGKVVFDGCTFTNPQWECIQITPMDGAEVIVTNCTFVVDGTGTYAHGDKVERMLHIQNTAASGKYTAVITNNKFIGVDLCRNAVIDVDDIEAFANVTCGGNTFAEHDNTPVSTMADGMIYVNINGKYDAANVATNTYAQFTQTPAAALHH